MATHEGLQIVINGGWHDAGDLSQGLTNTAEGTHVLFSLAEIVSKHDTILAARLAEEALWGLEWLLKTRFGDGYRAVWTTMDLWTDGIIGNMDDIVWDARNSHQANLLAATAEATAYRFLCTQKPQLASQSLQAAEQDWNFATEITDLQTASFAVNAALELYKATGNISYSTAAFNHGRTILDCQQRKLTSWNLPVAGFFYTAPDKKNIVHYSHDSHEQSPIVALSQLCQTFPDHPDWIEWYSAVALYSEYLRTASIVNAPFYTTPASIYNSNESQSSDFVNQLRNGLPLSDTHVLRRFPIWGSQTYRGNNAVLLSQVKALSTASVLRRDSSLFYLAQCGMEWIVGKNPFGQSLMSGEGYDNQLLYSPTSGNIVGALPVGIQTYFNRDVPYWASENQSCFKEVWVHPSIRWLSLMSDMSEYSKGRKSIISSDKKSDQFNFALSQETGKDGAVSITITVDVSEMDSFDYSIRASNLQSQSFKGKMKLNRNKQTSIVWSAKMESIHEPWVVVVIPNQDFSERKEIIGSLSSKKVNERNQLFVWTSKDLDKAKRKLIKFPEQQKPENVVLKTNDSARREFLEMVLIQPGHFLMGSPPTERGSYPEAEGIRKVNISKPYFLGKHEVTQAEWENVMGENPAQYSGRPDNPIENIPWEQCALFCNELSRLNGYEPVYDETSWTRNPKANGFRLPTEAEWEYACRAGTTTRFSFGDVLEAADAGDSFSETLNKYLWWRGNNYNYSESAYFGSGTKPVGAKLANSWGLHGMHGNVSEWCEDYWVTERESGPLVDPEGPKSGTSHAIRGGYFGSYARYCRSASRYCDSGDHYGSYDFVGFRILLPASGKQEKNIFIPVTK